MKQNGAQIVVSVLREHNTDTVFGYPGGQILDLYHALSFEPSIRHIITAHEQGAAHAADGYARVTGKVGVVIATSGPGATNLVTGIAAAHMDSVPMVILTGNVALSLLGKDNFQEIDITGVTMPITKHNFIVKNIEELADILRRAFQIARSDRPGPVLVDLPKDLQSAVTEYTPRSPLPLSAPPLPAIGQLTSAAELIAAAKRPFVYCGGGVRSTGSGEILRRFAERIDAPVGCTMMGLSALPDEAHIGLMGMHGELQNSIAIAESDLIIAVGMRFGERTTGNRRLFAPKAKILHIDIDPAEINKNIPATLGLIGDCGAILTALLPLVPQLKHPTWRQKTKRRTAACDRYCPEWIIHETQRQFRGSLIATDVGQHQMWTAQYYPFEGDRSFLTSGGLGAMGFGMGAAIGAMIATGRRAVLFTGDGSFSMNLTELATAVTYRLPLTVILLNNRVLGMVRQWQEQFFDSRFYASSPERSTDFVAVAKAFGADGCRVRTRQEMTNALARADQSALPFVIDCQISEQEKVIPVIPPGGSFRDLL